jgi:hypothetical protein
MTGVQITSMLDILERVKLGALPKESAMVLLGAAFPDMTQETAAGMVEPIEVTGPPEESVTNVAPSTPAAPPATPPVAEGNPSDESAGSTEPDDEEDPANSEGNRS